MSPNSCNGDKAPSVVLVTGGTGLIGRAVEKVVSDSAECAESESWIFLSSKEVDLKDRKATFEYFRRNKPTHVLHLAALVGGAAGIAGLAGYAWRLRLFCWHRWLRLDRWLRLAPLVALGLARRGCSSPGVCVVGWVGAGF